MKFIIFVFIKFLYSTRFRLKRLCDPDHRSLSRSCNFFRSHRTFSPLKAGVFVSMSHHSFDRFQRFWRGSWEVVPPEKKINVRLKRRLLPTIRIIVILYCLRQLFNSDQILSARDILIKSYVTTTSVYMTRAGSTSRKTVRSWPQDPKIKVTTRNQNNGVRCSSCCLQCF